MIKPSKYLVNIFFHKMPKSVFLILIFSVCVWGWLAFKKYEVDVFPVIKNFKIDVVYTDSLGTHVHGSFYKARGCDFDFAIPYSQGYRVDIETPNYEVVSRPVGHQEWQWLFNPPVPSMEVYFTHKCATGRVTSLVYKGLLKETSSYDSDS